MRQAGPDGSGLFTFAVQAQDRGKRLDRFLADRVDPGKGLSRTRLQSLIAAGAVRINDRTVRSGNARLEGTGCVSLDVPSPVPAQPRAQSIPLDVVFEDLHLVIVDKPAGLVVHPAAGHDDGTLVNALIAHCGEDLSGIGGVRRPGIVHRLDKDTTGLMVVAKTDGAHRGLAELFADHGRSGSLERAYTAFVWGRPAPASGGAVALPLGRHPHSRDRMTVVSEARGRRAVTHWTVLAATDDAAMVRCRLETGRTHQIRVHMTAIGHPLIGDPVYGAGFRTKAERLGAMARVAVDTVGRQALHASVLGFVHPITGRALRFESPLPPDLADLRQALEL